MSICHKKMNIAQFKEYMLSHKVFIFGSGVQGIRSIFYFHNWKLQDTVAGFIDNNKDKQDTDVCVEGDIYHIYSLDKALHLIDDRTCILIASLYHKEILMQLESCLNINGTDCIILDEIAEKELFCTTYDSVVKESSSEIIPRIIHYAWFGDEEPDFVKKNVDNWQKMCPNYEIKKWNDTNYDVTKNKYMRQAYEAKIWGFVPDYMRLDIVYKYGGIYLDTDVSIVRNLDDLLYQECFGSVDATLTMNLGSGFGAKKNCKIIKELRDYYDNIDFIDKNGVINRTSCNSHSLNVLKKYGVKINNQLQNVGGMNIYPMIFQGVCAHTRTENITDKTYVAHYGEMSWLEKKIL